ncbi:MAG: NAD(P)/FAD-dependent oxidoreductase [Elusimicrobiota bacterium]
MEKFEITVVGAGVVGLAVAAELAKVYPNILVIEKNYSFGMETSSRNSEVIHGGIYYPKNSLKAKLCVEGRERLYRFCQENQVAYRRLGKLIVAVEQNELADLEDLFQCGLGNGVADLKILSRAEVKQLEPEITAEAAIYSPSTGIIDSHGFMKCLAEQLESRGGMIVYHSELTAVEKNKEGYELSIEDKKMGKEQFLTKVLINSAGLFSDKVARMAGINRPDDQLKYCKGVYFRVRNKTGLLNRLVYPVPKKDHAGLGVHATLDLAGGMRLGPDTEYVNNFNYDIDPAKQKIFYESAHKFLPFLEPDDLVPDTAGIRPKLQGPGESFRDFIIKEESAQGFPGLINLIGIESPGLTASLAIARMVKENIR